MFLIALVRLPGSNRVHVCGKCGTEIASEDDYLEVMGRPVQATYENPTGVDCEIITFRDARNLIEAPIAVEEHTWFEGYAWRPVGCSKCRAHLGWQYEASDPSRKPRKFFGLLVASMRKTKKTGENK